MQLEENNKALAENGTVGILILKEAAGGEGSLHRAEIQNVEAVQLAQTSFK